MSFKNIKISDLQTRKGVKWNNYNEPVIPAWVADMDFPVAPEIQEVLLERVQSSDLGYPIAFEKSNLPDLLTERLQERFSWEINPSEVLSLTDVVQGLYHAVKLFSSKKDGVIIQTPIYPPFLQCVRELDRKIIINPLRQASKKYEIDFENLEHCLKGKPKILMLCNPHNPTGRVYTKEELEKIASFACRNDLIILSDEIHSDLVLDPVPHIPIASISKEVEARTITFLSASKSFNIAGLCLAFVHISDRSLFRVFDELPRHLIGSHNSLSLAAVEAAWTKGGGWLDATLAILMENRSYLKNMVDKNWPQVRFYPGEATYLAWMDMRSIGRGMKMAEFFHERSQVVLSEGETFGSEGKGFVRLNFATSPMILSDILHRMDRVIRDS